MRPETAVASGVWAELRALLALGAPEAVIWELGEHWQAALTPAQRDALVALNLPFALDDVGGADHDGQRLVASPARWIKLDHRLTRELPRSGWARPRLAHLVQWAPGESIGVVAAGIETDEEEDTAPGSGRGDLGLGPAGAGARAPALRGRDPSPHLGPAI